MIKLEMELAFENECGEKVFFYLTFWGKDYADAYEESLAFTRNQTAAHDWILLGGRILSVIDTRN